MNLFLVVLAMLITNVHSCSPATSGSNNPPSGVGSSAPSVSSTPSQPTQSNTQASSQATASSSSGGGNQAACAAMACSFSSGPCSYTAGGDGGAGACTIASGRSGNPDTGVPGPDSGSSNYVDCRPKPKGGKQTFISGALNNAAAVSVLIRVYEATNQMNLKACNGDAATGCQDVTNNAVTPADRQWSSKTISVPANTKSLVLLCDNAGSNFGDCGIAKVTVVDSSGNDVCGNSG